MATGQAFHDGVLALPLPNGTAGLPISSTPSGVDYMDTPTTDQNLALASDERRLNSLFGSTALLPLWIAEPYVPLAEPIVEAIQNRAKSGWYGYETRSSDLKTVFWQWMERRHGWDCSGLSTIVSPSVGTSIGGLIETLTDRSHGVIIQPPVFTDFKPLIAAAERRVVCNPLALTEAGYEIDLDGLAELAADPANRMLILCNPHNPVGRVWSEQDLRAVAKICATHDVVVVADEIHADLTLPNNTFVPFGKAAQGTPDTWAATHGPTKTFGLAGICDTLLITDDSDIASRFKGLSSRLHLNRNNVFATAAFEAGYREGEQWLSDLLDLVTANAGLLQDGLVDEIQLMPQEATYLAWLDFRRLGLDAPDLASWLAASGLAVSPGHWFGREGAGFARMTIAVDQATITEAIRRFNDGVESLQA